MRRITRRLRGLGATGAAWNARRACEERRRAEAGVAELERRLAARTAGRRQVA